MEFNFTNIDLSEEGKAELTAFIKTQTEPLVAKNFELKGEKLQVQKELKEAKEETTPLKSQITQLKTELDAEKAKKAPEGGDPAKIEEAIAQAVGPKDTRIAELEAELASEKTSGKDKIKQAELNMAIASGGIDEKFVSFMTHKLGERLGFAENDDGVEVVVVLKEDGKPRYGQNGLVKAKELLEEWKESDDWKAYFKGNQRQGMDTPTPSGSGGGTKNPFAKETFNLTEQMALKRDNPTLAARLQQEAA